MTAPDNTLTYDQDPPHRPGLDELGGGAKENHPKFPPDPVRHARAEEYNQMSKQIVRLAAIAPLAILFVRFSGGTPILDVVKTMGSLVVPGDFRVTDEAAGTTLISWSTGLGGKMPPTSGAPIASITEDVDGTIVALYATDFSSTPANNPGVRVKTRARSSGTLTDYAFAVEIH